MSFIVPDQMYYRFASNKVNIAQLGSKLFNVDPQTFVNWRWQLKHQVQDSKDFIEPTNFSACEKKAFEELKDKFHAGITPYGISLIDFENPRCPIRTQIVPKLTEMHDYYGVSDPLMETNNSPVKEMVHVYKDRVAWCVAQLCPVYCRYCFRKRRDSEEGLHFNPKIINNGLEYLKKNPQIRDVLITGGDPFIAHDSSIEKLLIELRKIESIEIIRFGTRTPVYLPYRITPEFADMLKKYHPIWINTHFNTEKELTVDAAVAIDTLLSRGIPVGNQSVFLNDVNDSFEHMKNLLTGLVKMRVRPYYIYHPQIVEGTEHLRIPIEKGLDIMKQLRGQITGFSIPQYVLDTPSGKVPLSPNHAMGRFNDYFVVEQLNQEPWAEPSPLNGYEPKNTFPIIKNINASMIKK